MQRFYFHIRDDGILFVPDTEGSLLPDLKSAIEEALSNARLILDRDVKAGIKNTHRIFEITGENGNLLAEVPFDHADQNGRSHV